MPAVTHTYATACLTLGDGAGTLQLSLEQSQQVGQRVTEAVGEQRLGCQVHRARLHAHGLDLAHHVQHALPLPRPNLLATASVISSSAPATLAPRPRLAWKAWTGQAWPCAGMQ